MIIFAIYIDQNSDLREEFCKYLSDYNQRRLKRMRKARVITINQMIIGELLIKYILCRYYGMKYAEIDLQRTLLGKPFVNNVSIEFSISHSGFYVVCASNNSPIGVDIQEIIRDSLLNPYILSAKEAYYKFHAGTVDCNNIKITSYISYENRFVYIIDEKDCVFQNLLSDKYILSLCCDESRNGKFHFVVKEKTCTEFLDELKGLLSL